MRRRRQQGTQGFTCGAAVMVGVDTGGTFTDLIAFIGGAVRTHKVPSTPHNPAHAVLQGLRELLARGSTPVITYASTVATNALLQRNGARVVLLTTAGFEDVIEIGRQNRPVLYALEPQRPLPLVPRERRIGIAERCLYDGHILRPLTQGTLRGLVRSLERKRPEAVAVCFLHAYANPRHERLVRQTLAERFPIFCSLSSDLITEHREYERASTTVINAYVGPVMSRHLHALQQTLAGSTRRGTRFRVMQSNGGAISAELAGREAVRTVLSGPAAGVRGAWEVARTLGLRQVITFDMGGTSTDVSLIDGCPRYRTEWEIGGLPLKVPAIDIHTVGAGGGSLAWLDDAGVLKVGPESAGADPGPACYGKGTRATVTDANVALGRLAAEGFLGGRMRLHVERARSALARLARRLRIDWESAAEGILRVANANMERALRTISVERGHDPRHYALVAFGGAAGQHACELGRTLGIRQIVIPHHPGLLSAWGAASADVQRDQARTVRLVNPSVPHLRQLFAPLERAAHKALRAEDVPARHCRFVRSVDVRYLGQSHELNLPFGSRFADHFHTAHRRLYGHADPERSIEVVTIRLQAIGRGQQPPRSRFRAAPATAPGATRIRWDGRWRHTRVYPREHLAIGTITAGPALITEFSATTFIPPDWRASVHRGGHLVLTHAN